MAPFIGITARFRPDILSHSVTRGYVDHVVHAGGVPVIVPYLHENLAGAMLERLDGIVFTGGEDIDPRYSGTERRAGYGYQPERDAFEIGLARTAMRRGMPTLGICRGSQILYVATGHPLVSDVPVLVGNDVPHRHSPRESSRHDVHLAPSGRVAEAYRSDSLAVTSYHHQGIAVGELSGMPWRATAHAPDRVIEAIEHVGGPWGVGVLWHPELPVDGDIPPDPIIRALVEAAA